jgi:pilus assembly protein Flp/PilA
MKLLSIFRALAADTRGATAIEYGLILAMIFLAIVGGVTAFSTSVSAMYNRISATSVAAIQSSS